MLRVAENFMMSGNRLTVAIMLLVLQSASAQSVIEVPFEFERNQIILTVDMNDAGPFHMLLDTGGNPSAVDITAARQASIPLDTTAAGEAEGVGGEPVPIYFARMTNLWMGDSLLGDASAVALDLRRIAERLGRPLHGVLGYSFLKDRIVQIDYARRSVTLFPHHPPLQDTAGHVMTYPLEFRPGSTIPMIDDLHVNGQQVKVTVDTGSSLALELYPWTVEQLGMDLQKEVAEQTAVVGARGEAAVREGRVESVRLGGVELGEMPVVFAEKERDDPKREGGNVGNALLRHFLLTIDYKNEVIRFEATQP